MPIHVSFPLIVSRLYKEKMEMIRVLFVCTGNICRSPTADGVFRAMVKTNGLADQIEGDSAGIENYHIGAPPDPRTILAAKGRGYILDDLRARQVRPDDFERFDYVLAMDDGHKRRLIRSCPAAFQNRIHLFLDFSARYKGQSVPDPYYGGARDFQTVLDMVEDGATGLLGHLRVRLDKVAD